MQKLKYTQKLGLTISIATTLVILLSFSVFITIFYKSSVEQIKVSLINEASEVVKNYIRVNEDKLYLDNIEGLKRDAIRDQLSLVIYDEKLSALESFGVFTRENIFSTQDSDKLNEIVQKSFKSNGVVSKSLINTKTDSSFLLLASPLVNNGKTVGVILIISPMENINIILKNSIHIVLLILPLSILVLYLIGQGLGDKALKPVRELVDTIKNINHSNLQVQLKEQGHREDDVYALTKEFNNMMERIKEGFDKQKLFISNSSHELRTPLARMQTSLDLIKGNKEIREDLGEEIQNMAATLTRLSILSKMEESKGNNQKIKLKEFVSKYVENLKESNRIITRIDSKSILNIDKDDLRMILDNVIGNAIKYSTEKVIIKITKSSLTIEDKGVGISKNDLKKVFQPFFRARNNLVEGTGLGLSIVKEICDKYGYKIRITSVVNKGTQVTITTS